MPDFDAEFMESAQVPGSAFVPLLNAQIDDILFERYERTVGRNNCVSFDRLTLPIPADAHRCNYIKDKIRVHRYPDGAMAIFHGPRKLTSYQLGDTLFSEQEKQAA